MSASILLAGEYIDSHGHKRSPGMETQLSQLKLVKNNWSALPLSVSSHNPPGLHSGCLYTTIIIDIRHFYMLIIRFYNEDVLNKPGPKCR